MSNRALLFLGLYGISLIAPLVFPPAGIWGYLFEWYNHPPGNWWGRSIAGMFGNRWSFAIGFIMITGYLIRYNQYSHIPLFSHIQTKFILLYTINAFVVTLWAYDSDATWNQAMDHFKMLLVYICLVKTNSKKEYINILILICLICCINWGLDTTLNPPGGRGLKISAAALGDENFVAAHIVAFLPLVGLYALFVTGWFKLVFIIGAPLMVNIIAYASSRGAFLAMLGTVLIALLFSKKKLKKWVIIGMVLGSILALRLFHDQFWERQETIVNYEEDASAMGRIDAWRAALILFKRNPVGYGSEAFDGGLGAPLMEGSFHTTHSMFFEILVAWGMQGIIFMYGFILSSCYGCLRVYKQSWDGLSWPPPRNSIIAFGVFCGFCSMLISSMFLNRFRWELWWIFAGVAACLRNIQDMENADSQES